MITTFYQPGANQGSETGYLVETLRPLSADEFRLLAWLIAETFEPHRTTTQSMLDGPVIMIGPRPAVETAFSSNAVAICLTIGLSNVQRIEMIRCHKVDGAASTVLYDKMTECPYGIIPETFANSVEPEKVFTVPLIEEGIGALERMNKNLGLGMDQWDIRYYHGLFSTVFKRNPTNVECFQLGQANSEHCRHWFFKGKIVIDGVPMESSLMDVVKKPLLLSGVSNSLIAFSDNSSAIRGYTIRTILPEHPGTFSKFVPIERTYHLIFTAETHNHPTMVEAFRGAETGTGGRIRDIQATGRGGLVIAGTAGYCVGNLHLPHYAIPGEQVGESYPAKYRTPLQILIDASNGASDYGNKFGEPLINGFTRSFGLRRPDGTRSEWIKPIMFTGGIGQMDDAHLTKESPKDGMLIIQIGGPAYRIGVGGGAASSMMQGENNEDLDFNSVQRGNAQMAQKVNRVIRACVELGEKNPILTIHDQGAGGPCNVVTELVHPAGGTVDIRAINVADTSMSVLEIWGAEYQERLALLLRPDGLEQFKSICRREQAPCEVLGSITGDGYITLCDSKDHSMPVQLELEKILGTMPQKEFSFDRQSSELTPLRIPYWTIASHLQRVFALPSVGSKGFLVRKVDRSVTGLVAQQQCCGPTQLPVADAAVVAQSHFGLTGGATANGEQPIKMLVNAKAGARMALAEMIMNISSVKSEGLSSIKSSGNWMWPAKLAGEGALLYDAAVAVTQLMIDIGGGEIDGGKDSLSMAATHGNETVKSPGQLVISGYVAVPDITKVVTPDLKSTKSMICLLDISGGKRRLGGSALAQVYEQLGDDCPDIDHPERLRSAFNALQELIDKGLLLSMHDRSDGGLVTAVVEMALAGNVGIAIEAAEDQLAFLFNEEAGMVIECTKADEKHIKEIISSHGLEDCFTCIGTTNAGMGITIRSFDEIIFTESLETVRRWWEATSDELEVLQVDPSCAKAAKTDRDRQSTPINRLSFVPSSTPAYYLSQAQKPKVAIIRDKGSNGDREMTSAFFQAGFEVWDGDMGDFFTEGIDLKDFRGIVFVGGFSNADAFGSAKGWAASIRSNKKIKDMFEAFRQRDDTFSFGVCNGCQLMALLGWIPATADIEDETGQPRFVHNASGRFESNWVQVTVKKSPAIMLKGMEGSTLGIWIAHGEGRLVFPDRNVLGGVFDHQLAPLRFVNPSGAPTEKYPWNPNGSIEGITALCSPDGRHLAMMPHPERSFLKWQVPWMPNEWNTFEAAPWFKLFQNAREWCEAGHLW